MIGGKVGTATDAGAGTLAAASTDWAAVFAVAIGTLIEGVISSPTAEVATETEAAVGKAAAGVTLGTESGPMVLSGIVAAWATALS